MAGVCLAASGAFSASDIYGFTLDSIDGKPAPLTAYKGKVLLLVNVASKCGYTPQYSGLEKTYRQYKDRGFFILGFPANNFGSQEPGTNDEIKSFCSRTYDVTFPLYAKSSVKGADINPLYRFLTDKNENPATGGDIRWNFTKFLVGRDGTIITRFEPNVAPDSPAVLEAIEKALR